MDTFPGNGAAKTAQAPAGEGEFPDVYHAALFGEHRLKIMDHIGESHVLLSTVCDDDHIFRPGLGHFGQAALIGRLLMRVDCGTRLYEDSVGAREHQLVKEHPRLFLSLRREQILHIGREAAHHMKSQIQAVFFHIPMGGDVVEVLGGGDLRGDLAAEADAVGLDKLDEPVKLIGHQEGIDRVAE